MQDGCAGERDGVSHVRAIRLAIGFLWEGLCQMGFAFWTVPAHGAAHGHGAAQSASEPRPLPAALPAPVVPPWHPERLVADQPLTPEEARVWAQLTSPREK